MQSKTDHKAKLVVIGNGMAGMRTVEEILKLTPDQYDITVFGAEPHGNYNRIMLSPVLAGEKTIDDIMINTREWYAKNGITLHAGDPVVNVDRARREVISKNGTVVPYDRLLLATGSKPFIIPVPGHQREGVIAFRDIQDVDTMLAAAKNYRHAVVIGGGLLGLEAANGLLRQGMTVSVVHIMHNLMDRQLDSEAAKLLQNALETRGLQLLMGAHTAEIMGDTPDGRVTGVKFKDGSEVKADLVVMAVGIIPNIQLAKNIGLPCERGILVNDTLQTNDPKIYAVGECVQHRKQVYGLVAPLFEQAKVVACHLGARGISRYQGSMVSTKLKVTGIDLFSAGNFVGGEGTEDIVYKDPRRGIYKRLVVRGAKLEGAVLYGDTRDGGWYFDLIQQKTDITAMRQKMVFGKQFV